MRILAILLLSTVAASAADMTINDVDQSNIAQICTMAARNPNVDIQVTASVASWCVNWNSRMKAVQDKPKDEPKADVKKP